MKTNSFLRRLTAICLVILLVLSLITPALAQRRGFGGGSFGRSGGFGGGSVRSGGSFGGFGSRRSSPSSGGFGFGGSSRVSTSGGGFGRSSSDTRSSGSSSFGRSGAFGGAGATRSTSINGRRVNVPPVYSDVPYSRSSTIYYGGSPFPAYGGGFLSGYSLGVLSSPWTHWMPFHPGFYVNPPVYYQGAYYAGGFSFTRLILGIGILWAIVWFLGRLFRGGRGGGSGGRRIKYTEM